MFATGTSDDYRDLLEDLDTFLTATGSAFGLTYTGTGNGTLTGYKGGSASVAETFTITATSSTNFTVTGSVSGSQAAATVGTPYTGTLVQFTINAGGTAFVSGDVFTLSTAPKWINKRKCRGATIFANQSTSGADAAENVVDGRFDRRWDMTSFPASIEFTFPANETIAEYAIASSSDRSNGVDWTFDYWTGSAWSTLDTRTGITPWTAGTLRAFTVTSPVAATLYRLNFTTVAGGTFDIVEVELRRTVGGLNAALSQYIWQAPGNDGDSQIFVGVHAYRRVDADYFNWELCAFDGFIAEATFYGQPGFHGTLNLPLWDDPIPYWFIANGRRVMVVAKISSQYELAYLGFHASYFSPDQVPYPMMLAGTLANGDASGNIPQWNDASWRWSNDTDEHRMPTHSDARSASKTHVNKYQMQARRLDGSWHGFRSSVNDSYVFSLPSDEGTIWPYGRSIGSKIDPNLDGSYSLWAVVLCDAGPNAYGQPEGIEGVSGQGVSSESLILYEDRNWLVLPNITRTDRDDFLAVRLD